MSPATSCPSATDAAWAAIFAWAVARAIVTAYPLESFRVRVGRWDQTLGSLVTCVPCCSAWVAVAPSVSVGLARGSVVAGILCWCAAWMGALFLDAALDRINAR